MNQTPAAVVEVIAGLDEASSDRYRVSIELLKDLSLDSATFLSRRGYYRGQILEELQRIASLGTPSYALHQAVLLLALSIDLSSVYGLTGSRPSHEDYERLQQLLSPYSEVGHEICGMYIEATASDDGTVAQFSALDWSTLSVHRIGTTSIIFDVYSKDRSVNDTKFALKLVHMLFQAVKPIAEATAAYASNWRPLRGSCPYLVRVRNSGPGWVLEEFIEGRTLEELIEEHRSRESDAAEWLDLCSQVFPDVLRAVGSLHKALRRPDAPLRGHGDLNPANIIVQAREAAPIELLGSAPLDQKWFARLIDIGPNLLAAEVIGRVRSPQALYVAPEVRKIQSDPDSSPDLRCADYYSLGFLLSLNLGFDPHIERGELRIPSGLYGAHPEIARVCADLMDVTSGRRLQLIQSGLPSNGDPLLDLAEQMELLFVVLKKAGSVTPTKGDHVTIIWDSITGQPTSHLSVSAAFLIDRVQSSAPYRRVVGGETVRSSLLVSTAYRKSERTATATLMHLLGLVALATFCLANLGWVGFFVDLVAGVGFDPDRRSENWQALAVGFTYWIAAYNYNMRAFGGVTFWRSLGSRPLRIFSEVLMWISCVDVLAFVLLAMLVEPTLWPWFSCLGIVMIALNNYVSDRLRRATYADGVHESYRMNSRPREAVSDVTDPLVYWGPTIQGFSVTSFIVALSLQLGWTESYGVIALLYAFANLVIFNHSQAFQQGPLVQVSLSRSVVYGERERFFRDSTCLPVVVLP